MRAYILSIGSELIAGNITDTNATFLAQDLISNGIELLHVVQVGDDMSRLVETLRRALSEAELVICTGGVGPTDDDLTREAIAAVVGETPAVDGELLETIQAFFASRGMVMPGGNAKQAWLIPSATALPNPVGTAPGWFVETDGHVIVAMPGVPREMYRMWREQALPRLRPYLPDRVIQSVTLKTIGLGESAIAQELDDLIKIVHPVVATYAKDDGVHVRVSVTAATAPEAESLLRPTLAEIHHRLRNHVYTDADRSLASVLVAALQATGQTLGIIEIGTGGRFGSLLYSEPEAGSVLFGLMVEAAGDESASAEATAGSALERFRSSLGMGVVAAVAPNETGQHEGTVTVALAGSITACEQFSFRAMFPEIQRRSALNAADVLHRALLALPEAPSA
jgi:nicotinamide-nucleotide amidase